MTTNTGNEKSFKFADHGKSTLADRLLEYVGAITPRKGASEQRVLDKLQVEKERGITVKAQTATLIYRHPKDGQDYLLNLIDTPGHVDFSSEVSRSLSACQGVILLIDANQGVQAQTVSNFYMAFGNDLTIVPVLNKIDLPNANPDLAKEQLLNLFDINPSEVLCASAKLGTGVGDIFDAVVERIPPPAGSSSSALRFIVQDSWYDRYLGTVNLVQVIDGVLKINDNIVSIARSQEYMVKTIGILTPEESPVKALYPGQIGVMTCSMRSASDGIIGDTFHRKGKPVEPIISVKRPKPMVYAGIYPFDQSELTKMKGALEKICLNDYSVSMTQESSPALGSGWRLGFLGILHMEVFTQRLEDEYSASVLLTPPSVPYKLVLTNVGAKKYACDQNCLDVSNPNDWPIQSSDIAKYLEPMVKGTVICPHDYMSDVYSLAMEARGRQTAMEFIDQTRIRLEFVLPLGEILTNFFDTLKSITSGYGSFDYEEAGYEETSLIKVDIMLNDEPVPELATIVHITKAREHGKKIVRRLEETISRQQFAIKIQASTKSKILARGDLKPLRKDVTAKCYGGDLTRKAKLLRNQAEGKKRMKMVGKVQLSTDVFRKLLS